MTNEQKYDVYKWRGRVPDKIGVGLGMEEALRLISFRGEIASFVLETVCDQINTTARYDLGRYVVVPADSDEPLSK